MWLLHPALFSHAWFKSYLLFLVPPCFQGVSLQNLLDKHAPKVVSWTIEVECKKKSFEGMNAADRDIWTNAGTNMFENLFFVFMPGCYIWSSLREMSSLVMANSQTLGAHHFPVWPVINIHAVVRCSVPGVQRCFGQQVNKGTILYCLMCVKYQTCLVPLLDRKKCFDCENKCNFLSLFSTEKKHKLCKCKGKNVSS